MMKQLMMLMEKPVMVEAAKPALAKFKNCNRNRHYEDNKASLDLEANKDKCWLGYKMKAEHEVEEKKDEWVCPIADTKSEQQGIEA